MLRSSPVAHQARTDPGSSSYSVTSLCLFTLFMGFSRKDFPGVSDGEASAYNVETWVQSLGQEDLEKEMATHSSILAWKIPWTEEPGKLQSVGSQRVRHD